MHALLIALGSLLLAAAACGQTTTTTGGSAGTICAYDNSSVSPCAPGPNGGGFDCCDTSGGVAFQYANASTLVQAFDDDSSVILDLPFDFAFFDNSYKNVTVSTNGVLAFGDGTNVDIAIVAPGAGLPNIDDGYPLYAILWADLESEIYTTTLGTAPHRIFVVEWRAIFLSDRSFPLVQMQLWLHENGDIETHYKEVSCVDTCQETPLIGFQNNGTIGVTYRHFNTQVSPSDLSTVRNITELSVVWKASSTTGTSSNTGTTFTTATTATGTTAISSTTATTVSNAITASTTGEDVATTAVTTSSTTSSSAVTTTSAKISSEASRNAVSLGGTMIATCTVGFGYLLRYPGISAGATF